MGEVLQIPERRIPLTELDPCEVNAMNPSFFGEAFLRPALLGSELANLLSKAFGGGWRCGRAACGHADMVCAMRRMLNKL